jgi:hypothetical protein
MHINMGRILVVDPESFLKNPVEEHGYHVPQIGVPPAESRDPCGTKPRPAAN